MDELVIAAMARWPNVPDVFGWLSLNSQGHWRLHPEGDALAPAPDGTPGPGVPVSSLRINQFINRNYARDPLGQWYFQNGPQRVFVRLDAAPFIFHTTQTGRPQPELLAHNGQQAGKVSRWILDEQGRLFVDAQPGPGLISGRDLEQVLDSLFTESGRPVFDLLDGLDLFGTPAASAPDAADQAGVPATGKSDKPGKPGQELDPLAHVGWADGPRAPLYFCHFERIPDLLGYVRFPGPQSGICA